MVKKRKGISFIVGGTVYPFDVLFSFGQTDEELLEALQLNGALVSDDDIKDAVFNFNNVRCEGRTCMLASGQTIVRMKSLPVYSRGKGILAHEIFHAAEFILHRVGIRHHVRKSGEAYAYLIGYLTQECYCLIGQKK